MFISPKKKLLSYLYLLKKKVSVLIISHINLKKKDYYYIDFIFSTIEINMIH